jgi:hypothetical protein
MPHLQPIVQWLDELIRATIPGLHYAVKWKRPYYGLPELGWIIELAAYDVSANVVFLGGADFVPPPSLGSTDRARYVKVTTMEEAQRPELREWLKQAGLSSSFVVPRIPKPSQELRGGLILRDFGAIHDPRNVICPGRDLPSWSLADGDHRASAA